MLDKVAAAGGAVLGAGGNLLGGYGRMKGLETAGKIIGQSMGQQQDLAEESRNRQQGIMQPYMTAGVNALNDYEQFRMTDPGSYQASQFEGVNMDEDPGVQYRMDRAMGALDSSAANRGSLFSGAQAKALQDRSQELASQEFNNAYNRQYGQFSDAENAARQQFNTEADRGMQLDQFRMNQLQNLTGVGQNAAGSLSSSVGAIDQNLTNNMYNLQGNRANVSGARSAAPFQMAGKFMGDVGKFTSSFGTGAGG